MNEDPKAVGFLKELNDQVQKQFERRKRVLSFEAFLDLVVRHPVRFTRNASQYMASMMDHYGKTEDGRFKVFDQPFHDGKDAMVGQMEAQQGIYRLLRGFDRVGRTDRLILLHGPNGSSKSTLVQCLMRGLEHYSAQDEGALYRFNWIFPEEKITRETIGFSREERRMDLAQYTSYADLPEDRIAARIPCELRDSPLLLLPTEERRSLLNRLKEENPAIREHRISEYFLAGDLSPRSKKIYDTLLTAYAGDYSKVLQHVQVERYFLSPRYKVGAVVVEPEMSVDAGMRQLTMDKSLSLLPPVLQTISLYEAGGKLIDANHGVVEFSDLFKRPVEAFKYLLSTCEKGTINLDAGLLFLDLVLFGTVNDKYLEAFKQHPDFTSFKGRMELVRVPYLRNIDQEKRIYDEQLFLEQDGLCITPEVTYFGALFAVMSRLHPPKTDTYPEGVREAVAKINPLEKAHFYTSETMPEWATAAQAGELSALRKRMMNEYNGDLTYEGFSGVSPREMKMVFLSAAQNRKGNCLTPIHVFMELRRMGQDKSLYSFLQREPLGDYFHFEKLLALAEGEFQRQLDHKIKDSLDLVEPTRYVDLLGRYILNVNALLQKSKIVDKVSGQERGADMGFVTEVEDMLGVTEGHERFRRDMIARIAAFKLDNPDDTVNYERIFPNYIKRLKDYYFEQQKKQVARVAQNMVKYEKHREELDEKDVLQVEKVLKAMQERYGYDRPCTMEGISYLLKSFYRQ